MITTADLAAGLDNGYAVLILAIVVGVLGGWLIHATAAALWLRFGPTEPIETADLTRDRHTLAALDRRTKGVDQ